MSAYDNVGRTPLARITIQNRPVFGNAPNGFRLAAIVITVVVTPTDSNTHTPTAIAVFALVHAISFNAPFARVKVEVEVAAPLASATVVGHFRQRGGSNHDEIGRHRPGNGFPRGIHAVPQKIYPQFFLVLGSHAFLSPLRLCLTRYRLL